MVAGHLQEKKGYYYAVLSYKDADKRRRAQVVSDRIAEPQTQAEWRRY